jgi:hypothetical protein
MADVGSLIPAIVIPVGEAFPRFSSISKRFLDNW